MTDASLLPRFLPPAEKPWRSWITLRQIGMALAPFRHASSWEQASNVCAKLRLQFGKPAFRPAELLQFDHHLGRRPIERERSQIRLLRLDHLCLCLQHVTQLQ